MPAFPLKTAPRALRSIGATTSLIAFLAAAPAFAITPAEVWQEWQDFVAAAGGTLTGEVNGSDDKIDIPNVIITFEDADGDYTAELFGMSLTDIGDGTVHIVLGDRLVHGGSTPTDGSADFEAFLTGGEVWASGTPGATKYEYMVRELVNEGTVLDPEAEDSPETIDATMVMKSMSGTINLLADGRFSEVSAIETADMQFDMSDPDGTTGVVKFTANSLGMERTTFFTGFSALSEMETGSDGPVQGNANNITFDVNFNDPEEGPTAFSGTIASVAVNVTPQDNTVTSSGTMDSLTINVAPGAMLPLPVAVTLQSLTFDSTGPIDLTNEPAPVFADINMAGLVLDKMLFQMFDPTGALDQSPMGLRISIATTASADDGDEDGPGFRLGQISPLSINLDALGASLAINGSVTPDNDAPMMGMAQAVGGKPPVVDLTVDLKGHEALLQNLSAAGLLPPQQAMMAGVVLGQFTMPNADGSGVTSHILTTPEGKISVNGQALN